MCIGCHYIFKLRPSPFQNSVIILSNLVCVTRLLFGIKYTVLNCIYNNDVHCTTIYCWATNKPLKQKQKNVLVGVYRMCFLTSACKQ